ncbi:hypothetical protein P9112_009578 [Eukaryota sp. TZLM1-RC]
MMSLRRRDSGFRVGDFSQPEVPESEDLEPVKPTDGLPSWIYTLVVLLVLSIASTLIINVLGNLNTINNAAELISTSSFAELPVVDDSDPNDCLEAVFDRVGQLLQSFPGISYDVSSLNNLNNQYNVDMSLSMFSRSTTVDNVSFRPSQLLAAIRRLEAASFCPIEVDDLDDLDQTFRQMVAQTVNNPDIDITIEFYEDPDHYYIELSYSGRRMATTIHDVCAMLIGFDNVRDVDTKRQTTAAILGDNSVHLFGRNHYGQLGTGDAFFQPWPQLVEIEGLNQNDQFIGVSAGSYHTLLLTSTGDVYTAGLLYHGDDAGTASYDPVYVDGLPSMILEIEAGYEHNTVLARVNGGNVLYTWGHNQFGQLGDGTFNARTEPVQVLQSNGVSSFSSKYFHTLVVRNGQLRSYGHNHFGQLGDGTDNDRNTMINVQGVTFAPNLLATGRSHSIVMDVFGSIYAWGSNVYFQLGRSSENSPTPSLVPIGSAYASLAAGFWHNIALHTNGSVIAWGANGHGQLGLGFANFSNRPTILDIAPVAAITSGPHNSFFIFNNNSVSGTGANHAGNLGIGSTSTPIVFPQQVKLDLTGRILSTFSAASDHTMFLFTDGEIYAAGSEFEGKTILGESQSPLPLQALTRVQGITAGHRHTVALLVNLRRESWGQNHEGHIGDLTFLQRNTPTHSNTLPPLKSVSAGALHTLFLTTDNEVYVSGSNHYQQLGLTNIAKINEPVLLEVLSDIGQVSAGIYHSTALDNNGRLYTWGCSFFGQTAQDYSQGVPVNVIPFDYAIASVAAGNWHTAILADNGQVYTFGYNAEGQLGVGLNVAESKEPLLVQDIPFIAELYSGTSHVIVRETNGQAWGWGDNQYHQLSEQTDEVFLEPVELDFDVRAKKFALGEGHTMYVVNGELYAVGWNKNGQLGLGHTDNVSTPQRVGVYHLN